jgi:hypothetical protein
MRLPGGFWQDGRRHREIGFRPLTGAVELAVSEALQDTDTLPEVTTNVLGVTLSHIGGRKPEAALVDALSVGDRQFLSTQLAGRLCGDDVWYTVACRFCGERFDFPLRFLDLPVKPAGPAYPFCETALDAGIFTWRIPDGADQKALAHLPSHDEAVRVLLQRGLVQDEKEAPAADGVIAGFTQAEIDCIEAAMEEQAPEIANRVKAACAGCSRTNEVEIDPFGHLNRQLRGVSVDIHRIASTYHWSEKEILSLPKQRRLRYLDLIDQARGMAV